MRGALLVAVLGTTALVSSGLMAQTAVPAPIPPAPQAQPDPAGQPAQSGGAQAIRSGPANICGELVTFLQPKPPAPAAPPGQAPAAQASGQSGPVPQGQNAPAAQSSGGPALQGANAPAVQAATPPPSAVAQSGGSGPVAAGQGPPAPQASGISAPVPKEQTAPTPKPVMTLEEAQALAGSNDLRACQNAAQKMRRAGVPLPPHLIALAGLKPELLQAGQPPGQPQ